MTALLLEVETFPIEADKSHVVHALVPSDSWWKLKHRAKNERRTQAILLRGALDALFTKYERRKDFGFVSSPSREPLLTSLVFRIDALCHARLQRLVAKSRIRQSEFIREALHDFLKTA